MAKIKVESQASGTGVYTLKSGTSNTDYTITLPDEDITLGGGVDGIVSTADATAITIDSSENVGIGVVPESWQTNWTALQIGDGSAISSRTDADNLELSTNAYYDSANTRWEYIGNNSAGTATQYYQQSGTHVFRVAPSGSADAAITWTNALTIKNDGRGVSQFTARAWCNVNFVGTVSIRDSHNISSITDNGTGNVQFNFTNSMGNANFVYFGFIPRQWGDEAMVAENTDYNGREQSTSRAIIGTRGASTGNYLDSPRVMLGVFGD
jgi:hypothetical protein